MVQKTVLRVNDICCHKCKTKLLKAVSGLQGVDKVEVDGAKGTMSVTGDADPYDIIVRTRRKTGKFAEVLSIGPDDNKKPEENKKPDDNKKPEENQKAHIHIPFTCPICDRIPFIPITQPTPQCHIL
ncbi:hypothetical protein ABFS83_12G001200 [Erythranthe nasuta]